ncbi:MAG: hypothetical protein KAW12_30720 [Candidatus Aminicenantes bacterium]|nr:hypothetical protein [Candidatus Aminicenantes bacterium]
MTEEEILEAITVSERMSELLRGLEEKVFDWADRKEKLYKVFAKELERFRESLEGMDEEWFILCSNQFAAGKIFANPVKLKKFLNLHRDSLNREEKQAVRLFLGNPWFYSLFSVEKKIGKNVLRIYDYSQNRSFLLYSENVQQMHRSGKKLFLCLLYDNGECCQTYGLINYFQGLSVKDIECYARFADSRYERDGDLSSAISRNPVPFMMLYLYAEVPKNLSSGELNESLHHSLKVESFSPADYAQKLKSEEKEGIILCTPKRSKDPAFFKGIYYEKKTKILHIHAMGAKRYEALVKLLADRYDFPAEPGWRVSVSMLAVLDSLLGIEPPVSHFAKLFEKKPTPKDVEISNRLKVLIGDITHSFNTGVEFSPGELAEKHDLPMETVMQVQEQFSKNRERFHIDIEGGFEDFTPPPPAERFKFSDIFMENSLFEFNNSIEAESHFRIKLPDAAMETEDGKEVPLTLAVLPYFLEELFFDFWGEEIGGCTILLYTLYLLQQKGKTFLPVRDYAVEFLRLFWQTILPDKSKENIEAFIEDYALFCYEVLYMVGLVDTEGDLDEEKTLTAAHKIKASPFFYKWLRPIRSH